MAFFKKLPDATRTNIANQLGNIFNAPEKLGFAAGDTEITLNESIELWTLPADAIVEPTEDLKVIAKKTGFWHHQVNQGGKALATALSTPTGPNPEDWKVTQFSKGDLASDVANVIARLEHDAAPNTEVRLLTVPAYQLLLAWLVDEDSCVVISAKRPISDTLKHRHFYSSKEVLECLRAKPMVGGIL